MRAIADRFWSKVDKSGECWVWTAHRRHHGYGAFFLNGKAQSAHRVAWELTYGPIPSGRSVLHACDNPPCVRPEHLSLGTHTDNMRDASSKGRLAPPALSEPWTPPERRSGDDGGTDPRRPRGVRQGLARLDDDKVREIRLLATQLSSAAIARRFSVHADTVRSVLSGRTWRHVA